MTSSLRIGKLPRSISEIAKMNKSFSSEAVVIEIRKMHQAGQVTPIFEEVGGVKVCLWRRSRITKAAKAK